MRRRSMGGEGGRSPRRRRWQELREHPRRGIFLLPSLLTTGNLFCGFLALVLTSQWRLAEAAVSLFVAMVLDILDGKVARLTKTTTQFGLEFDSLADVVSFCVAPAFMLYTVALARLGRAASSTTSSSCGDAFWPPTAPRRRSRTSAVPWRWTASARGWR